MRLIRKLHQAENGTKQNDTEWDDSKQNVIWQNGTQQIDTQLNDIQEKDR